MLVKTVARLRTKRNSTLGPGTEHVTLALPPVLQELRYPGIVLNALMLTFGTAGSLLVAYQARLLKVTVGGGRLKNILSTTRG